MTEQEIMAVSNGGHVMIKSANRKMKPEVYEMFINVGNTLVNCARSIRTLQFDIVDLKAQNTNKDEEIETLLAKVAELRETLKQQGIKNIKDRGGISHEDLNSDF